MAQETAYDYRAVKGFAVSSLFWGVVGLLIGILISLQLVYPQFNLTPWLTYGRLRPLHTNALIYGFTVPAAFSLFFYLVQRLGRTPLAFPRLAQVTLYSPVPASSRHFPFIVPRLRLYFCSLSFLSARVFFAFFSM